MAANRPLGDLTMPEVRKSPIVFVVDDDNDVRDGLKALLESVDMRCEVFRSTREFLQRKLSDEPSCLILDVRLPGASGLELQHELTDTKIKIPIIFISGHGDIPMTVKAMRAGAVGFLTKPVQEQELLDCIHVALERDAIRYEGERALRELQSQYETLTPREREVMLMVTAGFLNKQTAAEIGLSEVTVKVHRHNVMKKLGIKSLPELVRIADMLGIGQKK
jgi:FixJ family two-component response regulator